MEFMAEKDEGTIPFVLSQILDTCVNGITLSDPDQPDNPIVYANEAFELITGYNREEIVGHNCRFLQGEGTDHGPVLLDAAVGAGGGARLGPMTGSRVHGLEGWSLGWVGGGQSSALPSGMAAVTSFPERGRRAESRNGETTEVLRCRSIAS